MNDKVLICAPAWLGDMVMTHSLIQVLSRRGYEVHVLAPLWNVALLECMPEVTKRMELPITHGELKLKCRYQLGQQLRQESYAQAIVCQNSFKSALIPYFARIPRRTGWLREGRSLLLNDGRKLHPASLPLMVQRYVALAYDKEEVWDIHQIPYPRLQVQAINIAAILDKYHVTATPKILALSPGAAFGSTKQWPSEYYAKVAIQKIAEGWQIWLFGSAQDQAITQNIMQLTQQQCINLAGQLSLFETASLIAKATVFVGNDSGLLHVAAALGIPVIGIYGSTSPEFTPPLSHHARVLALTDLACRPCFQRNCQYGHLQCLWGIKPDQILAVLNEY